MAAFKEREANPSAWSIVDGSRPYMDKAIEALYRLDSGNPVVGRCVEYLSQLSLVLNALSMSKLSRLLSIDLLLYSWKSANLNLSSLTRNYISSLFPKANLFCIQIWASQISTALICRILYQCTQMTF